MTKQQFLSAYSAARKAAAGKALEAYPGQGDERAAVSAVWNASYAAVVATGLYMNGDGHSKAQKIASAATGAYFANHTTAGKELADRLDVFKRERAGEYICEYI